MLLLPQSTNVLSKLLLPFNDDEDDPDKLFLVRSCCRPLLVAGFAWPGLQLQLSHSRSTLLLLFLRKQL